jgi:cobalt/nickel transport protein
MQQRGKLMAHNYNLEILAMIAIAALCIVFVYTDMTAKNAVFIGTDDIAAAKISETSGNSSEEIHPIIPQWVPPSAEIESTLFGVQAAIGGMLVGGVFGYWIGQKKKV